MSAQYPHEWTQAHGAAHPYCARCRYYQHASPPECDAHPERPPLTFYDPVIFPGDVIEIPTGITRTLNRFVVHESVRLRNGAQALRGRYLSNPRGVDWRLYVEPAEPQLRILARGVAHVEAEPRGLLSA